MFSPSCWGRSEWFIAEQGVHQGGPFSMKLYVVFNADLLDELMASGHGARVCGSNLSCVAYADDIALMDGTVQAKATSTTGYCICP